MKINDKMQKAINKQINRELYSSYLYLSMATYFESINLKGFANWVRVQATEEKNHAMKLYEYLIDRGGRVLLEAIDAPGNQWKSVLAVFEEVYSHELKVTAYINDLFSLAQEQDDTATQVMLNWFINEQVEEEATADFIVQKLKMIKDSTSGIQILDAELASRK
jgi:ferritin